MSGSGYAISGYAAIGGGVSTPKGLYENKVYIVAVGIGTPQAGVDLSYLNSAEERAQEILSDVLKGNVYGKD